MAKLMVLVLLIFWVLSIIILRPNVKIILGFPIGLTLLIPLLLLTNHPKIASDLINLVFWLLIVSIPFCLNIRHIYQKKENRQNYEILKAKKKIILFCLCYLIPFVIIFHNFFLNITLSIGDAPFFYSENLKELFYKPLLWNYRNENFGQDQSNILWLYFPTFLFGLLNHFFNLNSELLIRIVFYFPATILSFFGAWVFLSLFSKNNLARYIASFLYCFNTYFLMVIDGGQIGIVLAYGFFPISAYLLLRFLDHINLKNFLLALIFLFIISNIDLRILLILIMFVFLYFLLSKVFFQKLQFRKKIIFSIVILLTSLFLLDSFWIIPFLSNLNFNQNSYGRISESLNLINLLDSFYLFQPHFPRNEFGRISLLPYYFGFIPIILFLWVFNTRMIMKGLFLGSLFIFFAFLAKGTDKPFGEIYAYFTQNLPLGFAFRDSSKFFIPLLLIASALLSLSIDSLKKINKRNYFLFVILIYLYLLLLIQPALFENLTGVLGYKEKKLDFNYIYENIKAQKGFFRTLWFGERPSLAYSDWEKPALSANTLYLERPFASMIEGEYDLFNYLHSDQLHQWLNLLGVKYIFFPENARKKTWSVKDRVERKLFLKFVNSISFFKKIDWGISFPIYQVDSDMSKIFTQNKVFLVIGGEEIYQNLSSKDNFKLANQGFIFLEDGKEDPNLFLSLSKNSADLIFEKKNLLDLEMVFMEEKMVYLNQAKINEWAKRESADYLRWKNELSAYGLKLLEFDYGKGIAFSTKKGEKLVFNLKSPNKYYVGIRYTNSLNSDGLKLNIDQTEKNLKSNDPNHFKWDIFGPFSSEKDYQKLEITNKGGIVVVNTLAILGPDDIEFSSVKAGQLIRNLKTWEMNYSVAGLTKYPSESSYVNHSSPKPVFDSEIAQMRGATRYSGSIIKGSLDWENLSEQLQKNYTPVEYTEIDPTRYLIKTSSDANWLAFTDHYNPNWQLNGNISHEALPFYSMINGFYLKNDSSKDYVLVYKPQRQINLSIVLSLISLMTIASISVIIYLKGKWS